MQVTAKLVERIGVLDCVYEATVVSAEPLTAVAVDTTTTAAGHALRSFGGRVLCRHGPLLLWTLRLQTPFLWSGVQRERGDGGRKNNQDLFHLIIPLFDDGGLKPGQSIFSAAADASKKAR